MRPGNLRKFALMSPRPAIGSNYLDTHTQWHRADMRNFTRVNGMIARLPRYYKDKIFTQMERTIMAQQSIQISDEAYWNEIERLCKYHADPQSYYEEREAHAHEIIHRRINEKSKF